MNIIDTRVTMRENSATIACHPQATPILIDIFRSHTRAKFNVTLNAGLDGDSPYDEFLLEEASLGEDAYSGLLTTYRNEMMSRL